MLPDLNQDGVLPAGVHETTWDELATRFGTTPWRQTLLKGLRSGLEALRAAGCKRVFIDGSFITAKDEPADYDACWDWTGVDASLLDPVLLDFNQKRLKQKIKFRGEFFPAQARASASTLQTFLEFFQQRKEGAGSKGIVALDLARLQ